MQNLNETKENIWKKKTLHDFWVITVVRLRGKGGNFREWGIKKILEGEGLTGIHPTVFIILVGNKECRTNGFLEGGGTAFTEKKTTYGLPKGCRDL